MIDTHCHIQGQEFDLIRDDLLQTMYNQSIQAIVIGTTLQDSLDAIYLCKSHSFLYPTIGIHPSEANTIHLDTIYQAFTQLLETEHIVGIGETGFDFYYHSQAEVKSVQEQVFRLHIQLAIKYNKPLIIHTRESFEETFQLFSEYTGLTIILHCFTGDIFWVEKFQTLPHTIYFSFSGIITFPNSLSIQEAVRIIPSNRILVETDAPYLTPAPYRGKQNTPVYTQYTAQKIADLRQNSYNEMIIQLDQNANTAFVL
jgi:TatD DNase family protein